MGKHSRAKQSYSRKSKKKETRSSSLSKSHKKRYRERSSSKNKEKPSTSGSKSKDLHYYFPSSKKRSRSPSQPPSKRYRSSNSQKRSPSPSESPSKRRRSSKRSNSSKRSSSSEPPSKKHQSPSRGADSPFTKTSFYLEEYRNFEKSFRNSSKVFNKVTEKSHDLFTVDKKYSLAHCVAEDFNMGRGVAVQFRNEFQRVDELLNQRQTSGGLAVLQDKKRFIYYLVTKRLSSGKPTYESLFSSLQKMRTHIIDNNVTDLAIPKIACGLDMLNWETVKFMIEYIFQMDDISIVVCLQDMSTSLTTPQKHRIFCKLTNITNPISSNVNLDKTIIIYLSSEDGFVSDEMLALQEFNFIGNFKLTKKRIGKLVHFDKDCLLYGCIVKKRSSDPIDFEALQECIESINKENKQTHHRQFLYFQAIKFGFSETIINHQIINIFKNVVQSMEVNVYWPESIRSQMPKNRYSLNRSEMNSSFISPFGVNRRNTMNASFTTRSFSSVKSKN